MTEGQTAPKSRGGSLAVGTHLPEDGDLDRGSQCPPR